MLELKRGEKREVRRNRKDKQSHKGTGAQGKTKTNAPAATMIAPQGSLAALPFPVHLCLPPIVKAFALFTSFTSNSSQTWDSTTYEPISALHAPEVRKFAIYRRAREVMVTSSDVVAQG